MPAQVSASHILLMYAGSAESSATRSKADAAKEIAALRDAVIGGADFAELAGQHSDCPSGEEGGELGTFSRGEMVPEFDEAAFALPVGGVSAVVETAFGYHIILRTA